MAVAFVDPHISNETKRQLARLIDASPLASCAPDPKTKLMWLDRPGMSPMLAGASVVDTKLKNKKPQAAARGPTQARHE